jgi:anti-anti-sigma factor
MTASFRATGPARLDVAGDLDLDAMDALVGHLDRMIDDPEVTDIVVDLSGVEFIDSSCIGALVAGKRGAGKADRTFRVQGARGQVDDVFQMTGVTAFLAGPPHR